MEIHELVLKKSMEHIASLMKEFRVSEKKTVQQVADLMKVDKQYVYQLESGKINFSFEVFFKYCIAVGAKPTFQLLNQKEFNEFSRNADKKVLWFIE